MRMATDPKARDQTRNSTGPSEHGVNSPRKPTDADWFAVNPHATSRLRRRKAGDPAVTDPTFTHVLVCRTPTGGLLRVPVVPRDPATGFAVGAVGAAA